MTPANEIYNTVKGEGYSDTLASIITAQGAHESSNWTSSVFKGTNNSFGYKYFAGSPFQTGKYAPGAEGGGNYAKYANVADSTHEVLAWLRRREKEGKLKIANLTTPEAYAAALKSSGYFGASLESYTNALVNHLANVGALLTGKKKIKSS